MASIEKGTVFGGRYVVQSQVGTGGMATVYRGVDSVLDRAVAIKVMLPQYANDPAFAQRFKQEAQAAAALQNPYIVSVYDWGRDETTGTYYIVMEYLRGTDLKSGIRSHGALAPRKVAQIGAQVCSALSVAHAHDIIHRDIKPQNIMIQPNGDAKVMDFGIARAKNSHLTQTNSVLGTAHYVSPEQAQGKELDATSDLYSLGVVMYEAATGKLPFDGDDAVSVALKQVNEQPVPPSEVNPNVDDRLEAVILCCMSKDPRRRFQSADELRHVLNNYINGRPLGIPTYAAPTARLAGGAPTQVLKPGDTGRTATARPGTSPTQRMARDGAGAMGTQRLQQPARTGSPQPIRGQQPRGQQGRGTGRGRGRGQSSGGNGPLIAVVAIIAIILIVAIVVGLTSCGGCSNTTANPSGSQQTGSVANSTGEKVSVPKLDNYTQAEAKNKLATEGLVMGTVTEESSSTVTKGKVIRTDPAAGTEVAKGSQVNLVISMGADTVAVPNILRMDEATALQTLTDNGLVGQYDSNLDSFSPDIAEGLVVTYTPANKQVAKNTTVRFGLSKGVDPSTVKVKVPGVTDWWYQDAENAIVGLELQFYEIWDYSTDKPWGTVISTDPAAETELSKGETVTLHISQGPEPVVVGDYTGWGADSAQAALTNLGLNSGVDTSTPAPNEASAGTVYRTDPAAGTTVDKGSWVTVFVYGAYVPPAPTGAPLPTNGQVAGFTVSDLLYSGLLSSWSGVVVLDGDTVVDPSQYGNYVVSSIMGAGETVPFSNTVTVFASPIAPPDSGGAAEGGAGGEGVEGGEETPVAE